MRTLARVLIALLIVVAVVLAWWFHTSAGSVSIGGFQSGPYNIGVYDQPYENYPYYEGRAVKEWDADGRCVSYCGQSPCTVWCR